MEFQDLWFSREEKLGLFHIQFHKNAQHPVPYFKHTQIDIHNAGRNFINWVETDLNCGVASVYMDFQIEFASHSSDVINIEYEQQGAINRTLRNSAQ